MLSLKSPAEVDVDGKTDEQVCQNIVRPLGMTKFSARCNTKARTTNLLLGGCIFNGSTDRKMQVQSEYGIVERGF